MQKIPTLVQDLGIARMTNSVYVGTMKFTVEQVEKFTDGFPSETPSVELLGSQLRDAKKAYRTLDDAYAKTLRSTITDEISSLDTEGDQLYMAVKQTVEGAQKMTFDQARVSAGNLLAELLKKYRVDTKENMISEWSKVQQLCEEASGSAAIGEAETTLGIASAMDRLAVIADTIREKITERSSELPEAQQMKKARATMDQEYKALITILNAAAVIFGGDGSFDGIVKTLNDNINYVKIHAMTGVSGGSSDGGGGGSDDDGGDDPTPTPDPTPEPTPDPDPSGGGDEVSLD